MIPDFKTYIKESIWSDMQDRSAGDTVRKEDDIDRFDINELCEYLKNIYKTDSDNDINVIEIEGNPYLIVCLYVDEYGYYRYIYYDGDYISMQFDVIETLKCFSEFERKFSIRFTKSDFVVDHIDIYPKNKTRIPVTNKFFIEVLDFILNRIKAPLEQMVEKISKITESIWSDMQDRSSGETIREEDKFINQMNYDEFFKYIYKIYFPLGNHNDYSIIRFIPRDQPNVIVIQIPLESSGITKSPYILTIKINKNLDKIVSMRISSQLIQQYPDISKYLGDQYIISDTYTINPVLGKITNYICLDVIDKLLSMVEHPLFKKST